MDGFAVIAEDTFGSEQLPNCTHIASALKRFITGQHADPAVSNLVKCTEIATGAPMPKGADAVVMVEHTGRDDQIDEVSNVFTSSLSSRQNVGHRAALTLRQVRSRVSAWTTLLSTEPSWFNRSHLAVSDQIEVYRST